MDVETYRARRLRACRAISDLCAVIDALPEGPYSQIRQGHNPNEGPFPGSSLSRKRELKNLAATLLRMTLADNDGYVSDDNLRFY